AVSIRPANDLGQPPDCTRPEADAPARHIRSHETSDLGTARDQAGTPAPQTGSSDNRIVWLAGRRSHGAMQRQPPFLGGSGRQCQTARLLHKQNPRSHVPDLWWAKDGVLQRAGGGERELNGDGPKDARLALIASKRRSQPGAYAGEV